MRLVTSGQEDNAAMIRGSDKPVSYLDQGDQVSIWGVGGGGGVSKQDTGEKGHTSDVLSHNVANLFLPCWKQTIRTGGGGGLPANRK
jgi:hypothetical protein